MSNEELVELIQQGIDAQQNMGELYAQNKNFIYKIALPYAKSIDMDDLMQESYFGLLDAVNGYAPQQYNVKFLTYAEFKIRVCLQRYCSKYGNTKRIPEHELILMSKYHKFKREYNLEHQEEPSEQEVMSALKITEKKLHTLVKHIHESNIQSMDSVIPGTDSMTIAETVADDYNLESDVLDRIALQNIWNYVNELEGKQQTVIIDRYKNNLTRGDVAKTVGVSLSRIGQIEQRALGVLRKKENIQRLAEEFGYDCSAAYKYGVGRFKDTWTSSTEHLALKHIRLEQKNASLNDMFNQIMSMA